MFPFEMTASAPSLPDGAMTEFMRHALGWSPRVQPYRDVIFDENDQPVVQDTSALDYSEWVDPAGRTHRPVQRSIEAVLDAMVASGRFEPLFEIVVDPSLNCRWVVVRGRCEPGVETVGRAPIFDEALAQSVIPSACFLAALMSAACRAMGQDANP